MARHAYKIAGVIAGLALAQVLAYLVFVRVEEGRRADVEPEAFSSRPIEGMAPALAYASADGTPGRLADHRGRFVLVHFWASWCTPCRKELPELLALAGVIDGVDVLAVSVDDGWPAVRGFFGGTPPPAVVLAIGDDYKRFGGRILPDTYLVGPDGALRAHLEGARPWKSSAARAFLASYGHRPR